MNSQFLKRSAQLAVVILTIFLFLGAGDDARFNKLGHSMMCICGCGQILLECNHVGCQSSDKMRHQLLAALDRGDNNDLIMQGFVQNRFLKPALMSKTAPSIPWMIRAVLRIPFLRDIPPRMIALGIDRPHVESPARNYNSAP